VSASAGALATSLVHELTRRGETVAVAESLTGGLVAACLTQPPGASAVVVGGVVTYGVWAKEHVLGVPADLLAREGPVSPATATAMAREAARLFHSSYGLATTGVAGPEPHDGHPVGEVYVACSANGKDDVRRLSLGGSRDTIREMSTKSVLLLLAERLTQGTATPHIGLHPSGEA